MATRSRIVHVTDDAYARLEREAARRGIAPDELADDLLIGDLANIRGRLLASGDAVALVREGRDELSHRAS